MKEASRIGRFQAKQNELKNLSNFVNYTPEQIDEARKIAKTLPNEKKEKNNFISSIREFKEMEQNKKGYKAWLKQRDLKEIENLKNRELTPEQIKKGNEEKEIIVDTVKEINIKAEEYSENLENAYDTLQGLTWLLAIPVGILTNKVLKLFKVPTKSTAAISIALPTLLSLIIGFKGTADQKEASRVGRYHARKDLLKNPSRLLAYTDEQMESAKDIKAPVQKRGFFNKLGQSFKFLRTYGKDKREYKEYKKTTELESKKLQKAFKQIEISDEQKIEAERLQKNVYRAFDEVDEMSQKYSEDIEAGCEIAKQGLSTAWSVATIFGTAATILGITKGKIRLIKPANKLVNFIFDKNSSLRKTFNELTKTVTSKGRETSSKFQRAIIKNNLTHFLEKSENSEIKNSVQNFLQEIGKVSGEVIIRPSQEAGIPVIRQLTRRDHEDGQVIPVLPQGAGELISVHDRHHDIQHHQIHVLGVHEAERFLTVGGFRNGIAFRFQHRAHQAAGILVIIYYKDIEHRYLLCRETPAPGIL